MDKASFVQTLKEAGIEDEKFADHLFQLWDRGLCCSLQSNLLDGSGTLDYNEFMLSMCNSSKFGSDEEKLKCMLQCFCANLKFYSKFMIWITMATFLEVNSTNSLLCCTLIWTAQITNLSIQ